MTLRPPSSTLFPYTTLFRSGRAPVVGRVADLDPTVVKELIKHLAAALETAAKAPADAEAPAVPDRKSTRLNSSHLVISYAVFCLKKKKRTTHKESVPAMIER